MEIAYSYIRFSSRSQEDGDTLRRQRQAAADWCERNGVALDSNTNFLQCHSAFLGEHRVNSDRHALAAFLEMIKDGPDRRILPGSYLVIENLDRLTREHIQPALMLVLSILATGVKVVQLTPELVFDDKSDATLIMMMIVELSRGHSESAIKSDRVRKAWRQKKIAAKEQGVRMTSAPPPWLRIDGDKYKIIRPVANIYRRIFRMSIDGAGQRAIASALNSEGVERPERLINRKKTRGRKPQWTVSYISQVLTDRRLLGEHEVQEKIDGHYRKSGETIPGLYPPIITEREWLLSAQSGQMRKASRGRRGDGYVNIFKGLLFSPLDQGTYVVMNRKSANRKPNRIIVNRKGWEGAAKSSSFSYDVFEYAILSQLKEIPLKELTGDDKAGERLESLTDQRDKKAKRKKEIEAAMTEGDLPIAGLAQAHGRIAEEIAALDSQIAHERRVKEAQAAEEWKDGMTIADKLQSRPGDMSLRRKLHAILTRSLEGIWLITGGVKDSRDRFAAAQVYFRDSPTIRTYVVWHRPTHVAKKSGISEKPKFFVISEPPQFAKFNLKDHSAASGFRSGLHAYALPHELWISWPPPREKPRG